MKRREFITLLGGAAVVWPITARAQRPERVRLIGVLMAQAENDPEGKVRLAAFRQELQQRGWTEGRNVRIEYRWGGGDANRTRTDAAELAALAPDDSALIKSCIDYSQAVHGARAAFAADPDPNCKHAEAEDGRLCRRAHKAMLEIAAAKAATPIAVNAKARAIADNQPNRLVGLAAELSKRPVSVIAAGGNAAARAAKAATATIPIPTQFPSAG